MDNQSAKRATIILGVIMIIAIGSSAILPLFTSNTTSTSPTQAATDTVVPTFAPSITDFSGIQFNTDYLHPTGLFSVAQPTGWTIGTQPVQPQGAEVTMNNADIFSVIQVSLQEASAPINSLDDVDAMNSPAELSQSWSNYRSERETARTRQDNKLIIDFEMQNARSQTFVARQTSWYDTDWVYSVRVVTPNNQIDLLKYLMDKEVASFKPYRIFVGTPADWSAYYDQTAGFIIRYPTTWSLTDSAPGLPASIDGPTSKLRVEAVSASAPLDEAAARSWVTSNQAGATVTSVQPVTRGDLTGFSVAYTYTDSDGNADSGLALLLNGKNNKLYIANLQIFEANVDLNKDDQQVTHDDLVKVLSTFQLLPGLNVPVPTATPVPTGLPSTPTAEATAAITTEPTAAPTNTAEATQQAAPTAEATAAVQPPTAAPTNTAVPTSTATTEVTAEATSSS